MTSYAPLLSTFRRMLAVLALALMAAPAAAQTMTAEDAAALSETACSVDIFSDCLELGDAYYLGIGVPRDTDIALELYGKACDGGVAEACYALGVVHARGEVVPMNKGYAATLYARACDGGYALACGVLGSYYAKGIGVGSGKNPAKAAPLYAKACDGGDGMSCYFLGLQYGSGEGVPFDRAKAKTYMQRALDIDPDNKHAKEALDILNLEFIDWSGE